MTAARPAAALGLVLAACSRAPCPSPAPPAPPAPPPDAMLVHDDTLAPPALYALDLTLALDAAVAGQVELRVTSYGPDAVKVAIPARADQIEWLDPAAKIKASALPRVVWTAWRADNGGLALGSRASTALRASTVVTLARGAVHDVVVDLGAALDGLHGPGTFARGWCARAWLVGGAPAPSSNVVCWPAG